MTTRILVVDRHPLTRAGIRAVLSRDDMEVVAEAADGAGAVDAAGRHGPDVVVLDLDLPDFPGYELCEALRARVPDAAVVVCSDLLDRESIAGALRAGVRAYVPKYVDEIDLRSVVGRVVRGETVFDRQVSAVLANGPGPSEPPRLSGQELSVLQLVAEGLTNSEIGVRLHLSRHTIKEYLSHAMRKLEASNRLEAVLEAKRLGLLARHQANSQRRDLPLRASRPSADIEIRRGDFVGRGLDRDIVLAPIKIVVASDAREGRHIRLLSLPDANAVRRVSLAGVTFIAVLLIVLIFFA
jgi:two-component system, NarL family, response regulator DevR